MNALSGKDARQRRFLMMLPVLVLPFVAMLFWALGGGHEAQAKQDGKAITGIDSRLPDARQPSENKDKLGFYEDAAKDSAKLRDELRNDPYRLDTLKSATDSNADSGRVVLRDYGSFGGQGTIRSTIDPNEDKVNRKLEELYRQLDAQQSAQAPSTGEEALQKRMAALTQGNGNGNSDPEMQQLAGMLDKILYIEHPEMAREKMREASLKNKKQAYIVSAASEADNIQLMQAPPDPLPRDQKGHQGHGNKNASRPQEGRFYETGNIATDNVPSDNAIAAEVAETRELITGATIKLRLLDAIFINGVFIPSDQFVYGTCSISGDRLQVTLSSIAWHNSIYPVALSAYDIDGIAGINVPDAVSRQVAKGSAGQAANGIDLYAFDNTLKGQAASAGVQAAKSLLSRKTQIIRVTIKEGYRLLLKNNDEQ